MHYFAYGSNMSPAIMARTCAGYEVIGAAQLPDFRLAFLRRSARWGNGVADVVATLGEAVWGVLYTVFDDCLDALDVKEGVGVAYDRHDVTVYRVDGTAIQAMTYMVIDKLDAELAPSPAYLNAILDGAAAHQLPGKYMAFLRGIRPAGQSD